MSYFKRALTSLVRTPMKSLVLFLSIFILGAATSGAISVRNAIHTTDLNLRRNMRPVVTIIFDEYGYYQAVREVGDFFTPEPLVLENIYEIGNLTYVEYFDHSIWQQLISFDIELWTPTSREEASALIGFPDEDLGELFEIQGTSHPEFVEMRQGFVEIVEGRTFTEGELTRGESVTVISRLLAEQNGLSVGDVVAFENIVFDVYGASLERWMYDVYEFEIIGLFEVLNVGGVDFQDMSFGYNVLNWNLPEARTLSLLNRIYVSNVVTRDIASFLNDHRGSLAEYHGWEVYHENAEGSYTFYPIFVLSDPMDLESFRLAAEPLLPDFRVLLDASQRFEAISTTMIMMREIANRVLIVAIVATIIILGLLITLFLHDRRHEVGVYLALGECKPRIIGQILIEIMLVSIVAITTSLFAGSLVANQLSQNLLQNEIAEIVTPIRGALGDGEVSALEWMGYAPPMSGEEMLEFYDVSLSVADVVSFYAVSFTMVSLSTVIPIVYLTRLEPKKILI